MHLVRGDFTSDSANVGSVRPHEKALSLNILASFDTFRPARSALGAVRAAARRRPFDQNLWILKCRNCARQTSAEAVFRRVLGFIESTPEHLKLAELHRALITDLDNRSAEQTQCDFRGQIGKTSRFNRNGKCTRHVDKIG